MRLAIATAVLGFTLASAAQPLIFKNGEVLGSDGNTYKGASPVQMERLIERAAKDDMPAGVVGNNVFVVIVDKVSFMPTKELRGTTKDTQLQIIGDQVVQDITGNESITYDQVQALNEASAATGADESAILAEGGIEGLDEELVAELQQVAS